MRRMTRKQTTEQLDRMSFRVTISANSIAETRLQIAETRLQIAETRLQIAKKANSISAVSNQIKVFGVAGAAIFAVRVDGMYNNKIRPN